MTYYNEIKLMHMAFVFFSGGLFLFRGLAMLAGSSLSQHSALKRLSYVNDSFLLAAGITLMILSSQYPLTHHWLGLKLVLLVVYILLGIFALRAGKTLITRSLCFLAALLVYAYMLSVAFSHHPLGIFSLI